MPNTMTRSALVFLFVVTGALSMTACPAHTGTRDDAPVVGGQTANPACDAHQGELLAAGDKRAQPWSLKRHLAKNFPDNKVAWLMTTGAYERFVVRTGAKHFGRCNDSGCYLFVAPAALIHDAVKRARTDSGHDAAVLGKTLGLPAKNFEGPLRMMTLPLGRLCARLPVDSDPGVWKCKGPEDKDCFKFGGYTSGGVPELMLINAPVAGTEVQPVP